MVLGGVALAAYSATCVALTRRHHVPVWFGAGLAWTVWIAVALALIAFAIVVAGVAERLHPAAVLALATAVWLAVALGAWRLRFGR